MLTADHVYVRRRGDTLSIEPIDGARRERAIELSAAYIGLAQAHLGSDRQAFVDACRAIPFAPRDRKLALGLLKLVNDRLQFEESTALDPALVRDELFAAAAQARRALAPGQRFDRATLLGQLATQHGHSTDVIEKTLYADLQSEHILRAVPLPAPERLVDIYKAGQTEAVLLRAVRIIATVKNAHPDEYRNLFRKLKFHQLLFSLALLSSGNADDGYVITIDGPYSLFESVARYGLKLALALPALMACGTWMVDADVRWGKARRPLRFRATGVATDGDDRAMKSNAETAELVARCNAEGSAWRATTSTRILDLPGVGVCIPDIEFRHRDHGRVVYYEQLGFWSRAAVWKRIDLVKAGLPFAVVFGAGRHLRVSEAALDVDASSALYVFARTPRAASLLKRIDAVARGATGAASPSDHA